MEIDDASCFEPTQEFSFLERRLPHLDQAGAFAFVTFRLIDSLPEPLIRELKRGRELILTEAGLNPRPDDITAELDKLPKRQAAIVRWKPFCCWDDNLDAHRGCCCLRQREAAKIVSDGLLKFDRDRYLMAAFVIMSNHVHLLAAFAKEGAVVAQGAAWRQYFARRINPLIGRTGHLWQEGQFDHLVRNEASFDRIRRYIIDNPAKAKLGSGEYRLYVSPD